MVGLQKQDFHVDFYVLEVHRADLILGVQWLSKLSPILIDFGGLHMTFVHKGEIITLYGDGPKQASYLSLAQFKRLSQMGAIAHVHLLAMAEAAQQSSPNLEAEVDPAIQELLNSYQHLFHKPKGLPPRRHHDHHIHLLPGTPPVNVKPYRYPHNQKKDMQELIFEMLE